MSIKKREIYFRCVPKEELFGFFNRLKMNLIEGKKIGDKKEFELEIRGTEEDPKGISLEIFTFNKSKYKDYFDFSEEYTKKSFMIFSLNLTIKEKREIEKLKKILQNLLDNTLNKKYPEHFELHFRRKEKKLIIELILVKSEIIKSLFDLGIDLNKFGDFHLMLKSKIDFNEILDNSIKEDIKYIDLLSLIFYIKTSGENIKYLIRALYGALKDVKLTESKLQKKYNKTVRFLNFINVFVSSKIKFNFNPKDLEYNFKVSGNQNKKIKSIINPSTYSDFIKPLFADFGLDFYFEELSLNYGIPKYQNGLSFVFKFPGFSKLFS